MHSSLHLKEALLSETLRADWLMVSQLLLSGKLKTGMSHYFLRNFKNKGTQDSRLLISKHTYV